MVEIWGRRLRVGEGFLGRNSERQPPPHQLEGLGSTVSSPGGVRGGAPTANAFWNASHSGRHCRFVPVYRFCSVFGAGSANLGILGGGYCPQCPLATLTCRFVLLYIGCSMWSLLKFMRCNRLLYWCDYVTSWLYLTLTVTLIFVLCCIRTSLWSSSLSDVKFVYTRSCFHQLLRISYLQLTYFVVLTFDFKLHHVRYKWRAK